MLRGTSWDRGTCDSSPAEWYAVLTRGTQRGEYRSKRQVITSPSIASDEEEEIKDVGEEKQHSDHTSGDANVPATASAHPLSSRKRLCDAGLAREESVEWEILIVVLPQLSGVRRCTFSNGRLIPTRAAKKAIKLSRSPCPPIMSRVRWSFYMRICRCGVIVFQVA